VELHCAFRLRKCIGHQLAREHGLDRKNDAVKRRGRHAAAEPGAGGHGERHRQKGRKADPDLAGADQLVPPDGDRLDGREGDEEGRDRGNEAFASEPD
jgi:hypothetical protein